MRSSTSSAFRRTPSARRWSAASLLPFLLVLGHVALVAPVGAAEQVRAAPGADAPRFFIDRIEITGDNPLPDDLTQRLLAPYLGEHVGFVGIQGGAQYLEQELQKRGHAFHKVVIPEQRLTGGVLRFEVVAFRLDRVVVEGNEHFDAGNIRRSVPELAGSGTPNTRALSRSLQLANAHPVKDLGLTVRRSEKPRHIDAVLQVTDRSPHQFFASVNNRGSEGTGLERVSLGYQYANLFDLDQSVTITYSTSPQEPDGVRQYGAAWRWPFYDSGAELAAFYTYSDVDNGEVADFFTVSGKGRFHGLRFTQHLLQRGRFRHSVVLSLEDKVFENDARFDGEPISPDLRSRPVGLTYRMNWIGQRTNLDVDLGVHHDLGGGDPANDDLDPTVLEDLPGRHWDAVRLNGLLDHKFDSGWLFRSRFSGQYTEDRLISGELFGLGGIDTLRGFFERETAAERGVHASLELWLPPNPTGVQVLGFVDGGWGDPLDPDRESFSLSSAGVGARWAPSRHLILSLDYGVVTEGTETIDAGDSRVHFSLFARN